MQLRKLLENIEHLLIQGTDLLEIDFITNDSRKASSSSLFVCIDGTIFDGHQYFSEAIDNGSRVIVVQKEIQTNDDITVIQVKDTRIALAQMAKVFFNEPMKYLKLIGVTGTNGKTSTVFFIKHILDSFQKKTGIVGTIENRIGELVLETSRTTPESIELQELLAKMVDHEVYAAIMEVSSHALELHRVDGCYFDVAVFTNLTLDHLDFHKTMERYRDAKLKLFKLCETAIINIDDPVGDYFVREGVAKNVITYGCIRNDANLKAEDIEYSMSGSTFQLRIDHQLFKFEIKTPGKFSVYNALGAIGSSLALGVPIEIIQSSLKEKSQVQGRFQTLESPTGYYVVVDYAHTPDGLENVLRTINDIAKAKVITVFGCGGDRDRSKRPLMGAVAAQMSDYIIITSDNPRTEAPYLIIEQIVQGIIGMNENFEIVIDRQKAIHRALSIAKKNDIVLIAGKGHENYQIIGKNKTEFDDVKKATEFFESMKIKEF